MLGTSSTTWRHGPVRMKAALESVNLRLCIAFWLFGLINNIFYVVILSAALDLVGPSIPKATVLLASIVPGLATKLIVPYIIHLVPYSLRIIIFATLSTCGMLIIALSPSGADAGSVAAKVAGIVLANISSGAGEVNFLALTHFYGIQSLAAWGSGTGGAGLIGAGAYALAVNTFGFSVHTTLLASSVVPLGMLLSYFVLLPQGPLKAGRVTEIEYSGLLDREEEEATVDESADQDDLLSHPASRSTSSAYDKRSKLQQTLSDLKAKLLRARTLVVPYMLPLFLVYVAEYTINQGVAPTLLFPLDESPFKHFRAFYPTYGAIYQLGVFISRSSLPFVRIRSLYTPTFFQVVNLVVLTAHALWPFIPTVWFVFAIVFWEGLLGGLVYVSTFAAVRDDVPEAEREFSLGAVTCTNQTDVMDLSPPLPTAVGPGDPIPPPAQRADSHTIMKTATEGEDKIVTVTSPDVAMTEPAYQGNGVDIPRIRLEDYYAVHPLQPEISDGYTTAPNDADDEGPPHARLDDYYAALGTQGENVGEIVELVPGEVEVVDTIDARPNRKKHKAMSAAEQRETINRLQARLSLFPQPQSHPPLPPLTYPPPPLTSPPPNDPAPVAKRRKRKMSESKDTPTEGDSGRLPQVQKIHKAPKKPGSKKPKKFDWDDSINPDVANVILRLKAFGEPFVNDLDDMISSASTFLDMQADVDDIALQLVQMEIDWKAVHDQKRKEMIAFFERHGVIPIGSVP
ncbi:hypothetical protein LTR08_000399 [Meristemomyces frigidus]|nr:hypothetical protein LTR08_000399 [Meristemomyces frigidus]